MVEGFVPGWAAPAKLRVPTRPPDVVLDDRLVARTVELVAAKLLTLIVAAPGAGKTTLAAAVATATSRAAWVHLDEHDDDAATLLGLIASACGAAMAWDRSSVEPLLAEGLPTDVDVRRAAVVLLDDLERSTSDSELVIVLDDLHAVRATGTLAVVAYLVEHMPGHLHLLATSRSRPRLPLARLGARQQLGEVGDRELALDADQAQCLLNDRLNLGLPRSQVEALVEASSGWVTGIRLLGRSPDALADYLDEELLGGERPDAVRFVTDLAVLDTFTPSTAEALTGRDDAGALLWDLARRHGLFVQVLDPEAPEYRYHDLLRSHLLRRLRALDPTRLRALHRAAAELAPTQAARIEHLLEARAWSEAADAIEGSIDPFAGMASMQRNVALVQRLPASYRSRPPLRLAVGLVAARRGDLAVAVTDLEGVLPLFEAAGDLAAVWLATRALHVATYDHRRWVPRLAALERSPDFDTLPSGARTDHHLSLAYGALFAGDWSQVAQRVEAAVEIAIGSADVGAAESLAQHLSPLLGGAPGVTERVAHYAEWVAVTASGNPLVDAGLVHQRAWTKLLLGDPRGAATVVQEAHDVRALLWSFPYLRATTEWVLVTAAIVDGELAQAERILAAGIDTPDATPLDASLDDLRRCGLARLLRRRGDVDGLRRLSGRAMLTARGSTSLDHSRNVRLLIDAQLRWAEGDRRGAERALREAMASEHDERVRTFVVNPRIDLALVLSERGAEREALAVLTDAVSAYTAWGTPGLLAAAGPELAPLLRGLPSGPAVATALAALDHDALPAPRAVPDSPDVLTGREVQVLRLLDGGASNQAIADTLHVSANTAKTHVRNLLRKLGAATRGEAVARARRHHLL